MNPTHLQLPALEATCAVLVVKSWQRLLLSQTRESLCVVLTKNERLSHLDIGQIGPKDALEGLGHTCRSVSGLKLCGAGFD